MTKSVISTIYHYSLNTSQATVYKIPNSYLALCVCTVLNSMVGHQSISVQKFIGVEFEAMAILTGRCFCVMEELLCRRFTHSLL